MNFEDLLTKISPKLKGITHKLNGRFSFFNEDDLYQEAMIHLWDKFNKKELQDKTDSFILQGCFFYLKNYIRKVYKRVDMNSISLNQIISEEDNTLEEVICLEDINRENALFENKLLEQDIFRNLSGRERHVISLVVDGLTTREIGRKLGISHVMVIKIEKRIRDRLKELRKEIK